MSPSLLRHRFNPLTGSIAKALVVKYLLRLARYPLHLFSLTDNRRLETLTLALLVSPEMVFSLKQLPTNLAFPALRQDVQTLDVKTVTVQHTQVDVVFPTFSILILPIHESPWRLLRVCPGFKNPDVDVKLFSLFPPYPRVSLHTHHLS